MERLEDRIRERAYRIWEEEGRPEGRAEIHWQKARALIEGERARAAQKHSAKAEDGATDGKAANTPDAAPAERTPKEESDASVDRQIEDSFPASDAPSYTAGKHLGTPDRSRPQRVKKRR